MDYAAVVREAQRRGLPPSALLAPGSEGEASSCGSLTSSPSAPSPRDPMFGSPRLPSRFEEIKPHQWDAIQEVMQAFDDGVRFVWLSAPPGSGKTLIAELVRRLLGVKALYMCTTKTLQDQFLESFPYASILKGRSNYTPLSVSADVWGDQVTCADCTASLKTDATEPQMECRWCEVVDMCPYRVAKGQAAGSRLAVVNSSYALTDWTHVGVFRDRPLVVADECDLLPSELMSHVEVTVTKRLAAELKIMPPQHKNPPKGKTISPTWPIWVWDEALPKVEKALAAAPPADEAAPKELRRMQRLTQLRDGLKTLGDELETGKWVYDDNRGDITFRPVTVDRWGPEALWRHGERWLCMSGSIVSAGDLVTRLGLDQPWRVVEVPMTYPARNRPIFLAPVAEVTRKNQEQAWPAVAEATSAIVAKHPGERVLVHAVSYSLSSYLHERVNRDHSDRTVLTYTSSFEKDGVLARFRRTPGAVIIGPSLDRGIDFPGEDCTVQVEAKVPFPNLGDKQVAAFVHGTAVGQSWLAIEAIRNMIQSTGRAVRSEDDTCVTYIVDMSFVNNLYRKHKNLFPQWWRDAIDSRYPPKMVLSPDVDLRPKEI